MSHQRYPSQDLIKEPHSVSVKVLRLSRPSLVPQYPVPDLATTASSSSTSSSYLPASLAYQTRHDSNPDPFLLSPILNLPASFGSAYVGETFSCTLCANNDVVAAAPAESSTSSTSPTGRSIRDVRIEAEMKTPGLGAAHKLHLGAATSTGEDEGGTDLAPGQTLQRLVNFDLKEEGNHVLAVTVSYYEARETSGRTRTFRKLYQFICKASLIVRTKVGPLMRGPAEDTRGTSGRRWVLEAQLENTSDDAMQLDRVAMELLDGLSCRDCNWEAAGGRGHEKPVLHPGEVEQVCFVVSLDEDRHGAEREGGEAEEGARSASAAAAAVSADGRITFGVLGIGWRGSMGNRGFLSTGKLGTRVA
ncbi:hypothetical protein E4U41_007182 [Claviceps citrina]|nr:hypothetical protein E4U41_007182 [Claviceps citrina]